MINKHYCPKCKKETEFKYYHGFIGYESFKCVICGFDVNDISIKDLDNLYMMKGGLKAQKMAGLTKQHFKAVADIIRDINSFGYSNPIKELVFELINYFKTQNPLFNENQFKKACLK